MKIIDNTALWCMLEEQQLIALHYHFLNMNQIDYYSPSTSNVKECLTYAQRNTPQAEKTLTEDKDKLPVKLMEEKQGKEP